MNYNSVISTIRLPHNQGDVFIADWIELQSLEPGQEVKRKR